MAVDLSGETTVVVNDSVLSTELDGEVVLLTLDSGMYYGTNETGAFVWELLQEPRTVENLQEALLEEYDVTPSRCQRDLRSTLREMVEANLVTIVDDAAS